MVYISAFREACNSTHRVIVFHQYWQWMKHGPLSPSPWGVGWFIQKRSTAASIAPPPSNLLQFLVWFAENLTLLQQVVGEVPWWSIRCSSVVYSTLIVAVGLLTTQPFGHYDEIRHAYRFSRPSSDVAVSKVVVTAAVTCVWHLIGSKKEWQGVDLWSCRPSMLCCSIGPSATDLRRAPWPLSIGRQAPATTKLP